MKVLVVDNDKKIRQVLVEMLEFINLSITEIKEAGNIDLGVKCINEFNPDLVFLDVELDEGTGFDLLKKVGSYNFQLVFITAYNKYAVDAFRFSAIDFLLKPIDPELLKESVDKARKNLKNQDLQNQLHVLQETIGSIRTYEKKIVLKDNEAIHFIRVQDIIRCEADGAYTRFFISNSNPILISKSLKEYDDLLTPFGFVRCHHAHLVNASKILKLDRTDGGMLILSNNDLIPVSQRKKEQVLEFLSKL